MSVPFSAGDLAAWTRGELLRGDAEASFDGASIDSRTVATGQLFVAIVGPTHDGHDHVAGAVGVGAAGLLVERGRELPGGLPGDLPVVAVPDTTRALGLLAAGHRAGFAGPVVAITGSNGKTSTKEMCAAIMSVAAPCLKTRGNLNNQFGLPLTLLSREASHESVVVELGMNHRGEIAALAAIAKPTVGVVTNVGLAHIENLGSREEIALEKGDLLVALPESGVAVVNGDDPWAAAQAERTGARVVRFGRGANADVRAEKVRSRDGGFAFELASPEGRTAVEVDGLGEVALANALAASAAALAGGASLSDVAEGLASYEPAPGRLTRRELPGRVVVIDDTYNANPQSMEVALRLLASENGKGRRVAVLGDMGELGAESSRAHRETGELVASLGIDFLFTLGELAEEIAGGARAGGMERVHVGRDHGDVASRIREVLREHDSVLVKGSRAMHMERVIDALSEGAEPQAGGAKGGGR